VISCCALCLLTWPAHQLDLSGNQLQGDAADVLIRAIRVATTSAAAGATAAGSTTAKQHTLAAAGITVLQQQQQQQQPLREVTLRSCGLTRQQLLQVRALLSNTVAVPEELATAAAVAAAAASVVHRPALTWSEEKTLGGEGASLRAWLLDAAAAQGFEYPDATSVFTPSATLATTTGTSATAGMARAALQQEEQQLGLRSTDCSSRHYALWIAPLLQLHTATSNAGAVLPLCEAVWLHESAAAAAAALETQAHRHRTAAAATARRRAKVAAWLACSEEQHSPEQLWQLQHAVADTQRSAACARDELAAADTAATAAASAVLCESAAVDDCGDQTALTPAAALAVATTARNAWEAADTAHCAAVESLHCYTEQRAAAVAAAQQRTARLQRRRQAQLLSVATLTRLTAAASSVETAAAAAVTAALARERVRALVPASCGREVSSAVTVCTVGCNC
jgi:trimeric autotransporter adhesin